MKRKFVIIIVGVIILFIVMGSILKLVHRNMDKNIRQVQQLEEEYRFEEATDTYELLIAPDTSALQEDISSDLQITVKSCEDDTVIKADYAGDEFGYVAIVHKPGNYITSIQHEEIKPIDIYTCVEGEKVYTLYAPLEQAETDIEEGDNIIKKMWDAYKSFTE